MSDQPTTDPTTETDTETDTETYAGTDLLAEEEPTSSSGRHPVNVGHLVMGVAFVVLVAVWALVATDAVEPDDVRWLLPVPWLAAGATGLLALTLRGRRSAG